MRKIKSLLLAGLVLIGFAACNNEEIPNGPEEKGNPLAGYLTLTIQSGSMQTKTTEYDEPGREAGEGKENDINDVTVVLTDATGNIQIVENTTILAGTTTKKFAVTPGDYLVYALVNNPIPTANLAKGASIDQVLAGASAAEITAGFKAGSFFMTNSQSNLDETLVNAGESLEISAGDEKVVKVNVDRLAAKVRDKTVKPTLTKLLAKEDVTTIMDGVRVVGFVPMNLNPDMNIIQKWAVENPGGDPETLGNKVLSTPVHETAKYLLPATTYKTVEEEIGVADLTKEDDFVKTVYVSENRPTINVHDDGVVTAATKGKTTAVIYRVVAQKDGADLTETFYAYNGKAYATLTDLPDALGDLSGKGIADLRKMGISVYEKGIMYYTYYIENKNTNYQLGGEEYYGVFRNSIYDLTINSIAELGDDVPDNSTDIEEEVDPEDAKISVEVTINDWVLNKIGIDF